ncbi:MAG: sugar transferase [Lachnospiraceae bacterium]|nr:sugar transferase [Lachnospiraceae bacterium]
MKAWNELPKCMQCDEVRPYYETLKKREGQILCKRVFDITVAIVALFILALPMVIISILIALDSKGGVLYRQKRVTTYGREFYIHKFRTMVANADRIGSAVTVSQDSRVTGIGRVLRKYRLDEFPQLFDVIKGDMSFVGTRPEVPRYVKQYTPEMLATLLLPAGITSEASLRYKDEATLLQEADDADRVYVEQILPEKMKYNLESIRNFSFLNEIRTMFRTVLAVLGKEYEI